MQVFWNNIYENAHKIISWNPNKGTKNVEKGMEVTADASDIGTEGGILS